MPTAVHGSKQDLGLLRRPMQRLASAQRLRPHTRLSNPMYSTNELIDPISFYTLANTAGSMTQQDLTGPPTKARYTCMSVCLSVAQSQQHLCPLSAIGYAVVGYCCPAQPDPTQKPKSTIEQHQHRASSVLNRNVREFGVARLFDGSHDSCWNSEQVDI